MNLTVPQLRHILLYAHRICRRNDIKLEVKELIGEGCEVIRGIYQIPPEILKEICFELTKEDMLNSSRPWRRNENISERSS